MKIVIIFYRKDFIMKFTNYSFLKRRHILEIINSMIGSFVGGFAGIANSLAIGLLKAVEISSVTGISRIIWLANAIQLPIAVSRLLSNVIRIISAVTVVYCILAGLSIYTIVLTGSTLFTIFCCCWRKL